MRALLLLLLSFPSLAAVTTTPGPWDLYRGASKVSSHQTEAACAAAADALGVARTYTCRTRTTVKVTADAPTPPTPPTVTWTECARETQLCVFAGRREVRYFGKQAGQQLITKVAEGQVQCDDSAFGAGPTTYENFCAFSSATTTAPVTVNQAPAPGPAPNPTPPPTGTAAGPRVATFTASGPITASSGQVISGLRISNPNGACITIPPGSANVTVRDSDIGPCAGDASILVQGAGAVIEHNFVHEGRRGVYVTHTSNATVRANKVHGPFAGNSCGTSNPSHCSSAIQFDAVQTGEADGNEIRGSNYGSDALSMFESSGMRLVNNDIDVNIGWKDAAPFTMGDSTTGNPGRDNYVAGNTVRQQGGVPPGVFGSTANTILERNCLTSGIQAYNFSGVFNGVTVRNNVIGPGSFVPDTSVIAGWNTNIFSSDCSLLPQ